MTMKQERFLMVPYKLLNASGYVNKAGECVKMNLSDKIIYAHIKNRFEFFKGLGKEYYDTQKDIADACNMDLKAVGNILRRFIKNGLTTIYKKPYGNFVKNVYTSVPPLHLWYKGVDVAQEFLDDYEYVIPEDFVPTLPDIGYSREYETQENDIDLENWK